MSQPAMNPGGDQWFPPELKAEIDEHLDPLLDVFQAELGVQAAEEDLRLANESLEYFEDREKILKWFGLGIGAAASSGTVFMVMNNETPRAVAEIIAAEVCVLGTGVTAISLGFYAARKAVHHKRMRRRNS